MSPSWEVDLKKSRPPEMEAGGKLIGKRSWDYFRDSQYGLSNEISQGNRLPAGVLTFGPIFFYDFFSLLIAYL